MKKLLWLIPLLTLVLAAYWLGRHEASAGHAPPAFAPASAPGSDPVASTVSAEAEPLPVAVASAEPLPPAGTPLALMFDQLKLRADSGESRAACRLGMELVRCRMLRRRALYLPSALDSAESAALATGADAHRRLQSQNEIDESRLRLLEAEKQCRDLPEERFLETFRYLRQAAHAGHGEAVVAYAEGAGFYPGDLSMLRNPQFDLWRREAPLLVERALTRGTAEVVMLWTIAHDHDDSPFAALVPNDAVHAQALRLLRQRLLGESLAQSPSMSTADYQSALARSETMFKQYFAGQVREAIDAPSWMAVDLTNPAGVSPDRRAPCEQVR